MRWRTFVAFVSRIPAAEAMENLSEVMVTSYPHMDEKGRSSVKKLWLSRAGIEEQRHPGMGWDRLRSVLRHQKAKVAEPPAPKLTRKKEK